MDDDVYLALAALKESDSESFGDVIAKLIREAKHDKYLDGLRWWTRGLEKRSSAGISIKTRDTLAKTAWFSYLNCHNIAAVDARIIRIEANLVVCEEHAALLKARYRDDITTTEC